MTPLRVAVLLAGCWAIPVLISFLPIMQGWNNIGITDLVSTLQTPLPRLALCARDSKQTRKVRLGGWAEREPASGPSNHPDSQKKRANAFES